MIEFYKYQGTGNDFILIDNRTSIFTGDKIKLAQRWCDRRFGIGSDGLIFIENSNDANFMIDFYNPDGSQSFCGNGSRCAVDFAKFLGITKTNSVSFNAIDGNHIAEITTENIRIKMKDVAMVEIIGDDYFIHTGSPHYISYEKSELRNIVEVGKAIRYSEKHKPAGTNVNLVEEIVTNQIRIRTYERGVEDETFSCGTGAVACALSYAHKHQLADGTVIVDVKGGQLKVEFKKDKNGFSAIWLEGPAEQVFKGTFNDNIN